MKNPTQERRRAGRGWLSRRVVKERWRTESVARCPERPRGPAGNYNLAGINGCDRLSGFYAVTMFGEVKRGGDA